MRSKRIVVFVTAIAVLALPAALFAWGERGHRITGEVAARKLPAEMPAFFRAATKQLAYLNPEPDRWRDRGEQTSDAALDNGFSQDTLIHTEMAAPAVLAAALKAPDRYAYIDTLAAAHIK